MYTVGRDILPFSYLHAILRFVPKVPLLSVWRKKVRLSEATEKKLLIFLFARHFGFLQTSSTSYYTKIIVLSQRNLHYLIWRKNERLSDPPYTVCRKKLDLYEATENKSPHFLISTEKSVLHEVPLLPIAHFFEFYQPSHLLLQTFSKITTASNTGLDKNQSFERPPYTVSR